MFLSWSIRRNWQKFVAIVCIICKYSRCTNSPCINSAARLDSSFFKDVNKMFNQASDILSRQIFVYDNGEERIKTYEM